MTESAKIAAANNYSRDVAAADAAYNQGVVDLNHYIRSEQERLDDKEYERKWNEDERDYNRGQDAKAEQDEIYGEVMTKIESGEFNTTTELSSYLNDKTIDTDGDGVAESSFLDLMSPAQRATVQGKLSYYKKKPEQIAADEEYNYQVTTADNKQLSTTRGALSQDDKFLWWGGGYDEGNNFTVKVGETEYRVQSGGEADAASTAELKRKHNDAKDGEVVKHGDTIYLYKNGKYYIVEKRPSSDAYNALFTAMTPTT